MKGETEKSDDKREIRQMTDGSKYSVRLQNHRWPRPEKYGRTKGPKRFRKWIQKRH